MTHLSHKKSPGAFETRRGFFYRAVRIAGPPHPGAGLAGNIDARFSGFCFTDCLPSVR
ncbi:hypothetical protein OBV_41230 [Oscillibacter valericigenes Sjm18-20]|nr:hypothetical protein OBV_41230 [Oscillibacter valericigenes Sjm18-20]